MKTQLYIVSLLVLFLVCDLSAQTTNFDFELTSPGTYTTSNAVSGWTISSQTASSCPSSSVWNSGSSEFSIVATPFFSFPVIGTIPSSPLGGNNIAQLNNLGANSYSTRLLRSVAVSTLNTLIQFAYAGVWQDGLHTCCEQTSFKVRLYDCLGNLVSCPSYSLAGAGCQYVPTYSVTSGTSWTNWQVKYIDLTPYIGSCITLEVIVNDCIHGDHYGTAFFDATYSAALPCVIDCYWLSPTLPIPDINFCSGGSLATINAPLGYSAYFWSAPLGYPITASQSTLSSLTLTNAAVNNVYTVSLVNSGATCIYATTYTLLNSSVNIVGIATNPSCYLGTSGSATVLTTGSGSGYSYNWVNSNNSTVATTSVANNLAPGIYSISVKAIGSQSVTCGTAVSMVTIGTTPPALINILKPFCGSEAYFSYPGGSNYQWYNNLTAISATAGGTSSSYTTTSPALNGSIYYLRYVSSQGCADSLKFTLAAMSPGILNVSYNPLVCQGASNGTVVLALSPTPGSPQGLNAFSVFSTGTSTPVYSASVNPTSSNTYTVNNLYAGGTYSVNAFDGSCKYSINFSVTPFVFNYSLTPSNSPTLCSGNVIPAAITFPVPPSLTQYSYSWSPTTFLAGGVGSLPNTLILSSTPPGSITTIIYTVVVTPSVANCPLTKTLSIIIANPLSPTIDLVPSLCTNSSAYTITANPPGGTYSAANNILSSNGILSPSLAAIGANTFTYANTIGTCVASSSASFMINTIPNISISVNLSVCEGQSATLLANGANTYTWSNSVIHPFITVSPSLTSIYTVMGSDAITNCTNTKSITLSVLPNPTLTILGDSLLCLGETRTLLASGAITYSWSNGSLSQSISVSPNISTTYTLQGLNLLGNCSSMKTISISVLPCAGISTQNISEEIGARIYPNPTKSLLYIQTENEILCSLHDGLGKSIFEKQLLKGKETLDMSALASGVYFLSFKSKTSTQVVKVVKMD